MKIAKVRHRVMASLLDFLIIFSIMLITFITVWPGLLVDIVKGSAITIPMVVKLVRCLIIYTFILLTYYVVIPILLKGQTIGEKILFLRIVNEDDSSVKAITLVLRGGVGRILFSTLSFGLLEIISLFFMIIRDDNKSILDLFSKTKVVDIKEE